MSEELLRIEDLYIRYKVEDGYFNGVSGLNLSLNKGDKLGIIGESGSGKTSLAMSILGLIEDPHRLEGRIYYKGRNLLEMDRKELDRIRWKEIAIVFQNSLDVLNPLLTIGEQIFEVIDRHLNLSKKEGDDRVEELLLKVDLDPEVKDKYPHELSGGMRQKALVAMAISCDPELLIVDEPTSALDILSKNNIIELLRDIEKDTGTSLLVISHELDTIMKLTERIKVMYSGSIVEKGYTDEVLDNPEHTYTRGLISSSPDIDPFGDMWGIPGEACFNGEEGCPFKNRCTQKIEKCDRVRPSLEEVSKNRYVACNRGGISTVLRASGINKSFSSKKTLVRACKDCSIEVRAGEVVALIGESGSGKTTLASILAGIIGADSGEVFFQDKKLKSNNFTSIKGGIQMVFQDPFSSINEKLTIREAVGEPLKILGEDKDYIERKVRQSLEDTRFTCDESLLNRRCESLSGGQRQRVALARALVMEPKLLIADEISSMLDLSTQANILRLLKGLQNSLGFSMLYITHDLAVARKVSDRVYVMKDGDIVEKGPVNKIFTRPEKAYTKELVMEGVNVI